MKLFLLVALSMTAFAANSVLNRIGVAHFGMDPFVFAVIRVAAGAAMLAVLIVLRGQSPIVNLSACWRGALALATYMLGFSWAYLSLGAGLGALILFGSLQMMMFGWALWQGQAVPLMRSIGAFFALIGLAVLLWPVEAAPLPFWGVSAMLIATAGWAAYTILGQGARDPLAVTAGNFILCLPLVALSLLAANTLAVSFGGAVAAIIAGAVTSGLGYALWYRALPSLPTTVAAVAQLSVPVIAVAAGAIFLSEPISLRMVIAGLLVLGGIAVSNVQRAPKDRN